MPRTMGRLTAGPRQVDAVRASSSCRMQLPCVAGRGQCGDISNTATFRHSRGGRCTPAGASLMPSAAWSCAPRTPTPGATGDEEVDCRLRDARPDEAAALRALRARMQALGALFDDIRTPYVVGGRGYTHSIPNYGRVIREGLDRYAERVNEGLAAAERRSDVPAAEFFRGLQDVLAGTAEWLRPTATSSCASGAILSTSTGSAPTCRRRCCCGSRTASTEARHVRCNRGSTRRDQTRRLLELFP